VRWLSFCAGADSIVHSLSNFQSIQFGVSLFDERIHEFTYKLPQVPQTRQLFIVHLEFHLFTCFFRVFAIMASANTISLISFYSMYMASFPRWGYAQLSSNVTNSTKYRVCLWA